MEWLFDKSGNAELFLYQDRFISREGRNLGWLYNNDVYHISTGRHIGWYENGILYNGNNEVVAFARNCQGHLPSRPGIGGIPGTPGIPGRPGKPGFGGYAGFKRGKAPVKKWLILFAEFLVFFVPAQADENRIFRILDENGKEITQYAGVPDIGDEYIAGNNGHFRIISVDEGTMKATAQMLGQYELPDVSWLQEQAQPVAAQKRAVAIYCTHSDESYKPTDGVSSDEQRGGIYDVAENLKQALESKGVTVYYSDETHHPHDAGAYRRSRATAASLLENGVDAIFDIHRDGIPDLASYEGKIKGEDTTMVRLLVGKSNQNASANKQFAAQIKAVADELYPGLIKDIYIGKGSYNQDLSGQSVLLEFGTYTNEKGDVLNSTGYMADVMNKTLYGGVTGAAEQKGGAAGVQKNSGGAKGILWLVLAFVVGALIFAFVSTGRGKDTLHQFKRTFQEMGGGLFGGKKGK